MKRILSIFIACVLLFACFSVNTFAESAKNLKFEITADGKDEVVVEAGNEFTVDLYLNNITDDASYTITNLQNEIEFDENFFEFVKVDCVKATDASVLEYSSYTVVKTIFLKTAATKFENKELLARITFKVKKGCKNGSSSIFTHLRSEAKDSITPSIYNISTQDMTVYIGEKPARTYTITYKDGNDTVHTENKAGMATVYELPYVPTGKRFLYWKDTDGKTWKPGDSYTVEKDITFTAVWKEKYKLTFETNGGTAITSVEKWNDGDTTVDLSQYTPTKTGFTFGGWYSDAGLTKKITKITMTENTIIYAKWTSSGGSTPPVDDNKDDTTNYKPAIMTDEHYAYIMGREDGKIYPQANLTRAEAATIFFRLLKEDVRAKYLTKDNKFADVESGVWYNTAVSTLANLGLINGRTATTYAPNATITRAELTTIVARLAEAEYNGSDLFTDISGHWARNYINIAASIKWVNGENGKFRPDDNITRAEVMTLINRVLNRQPETTADLLNGMKVWPDNSNTSVWYYMAVQEATNSHEYKLKADGIHETWSKLTDDPDWAAMGN